MRVLLPPSVASNPKFVRQLHEAQRMQQELLRSDPPLTTSLALHLELLPESVHAEARRLGALLAEVLGLPPDAPLEQLHRAIDGFSPARRAHDRVMSSKRRLCAPLADAARAALLQGAYDRLICETIAPFVANRSPGLERLHYATFPTLRVQTPSSSVATIRPHLDGMYGLEPGSLNVWLPLTEVREVSALWVEQSVGTSDFRPIRRPTLFDGRRSVHFTVPNRSRLTRVSLDFRLVPGSCFDEESRLARQGYYSTASVDRHTSRWVKTSHGRVSELHGLPHTAKPRITAAACVS